VWGFLAYDPALNLVYYGTVNPGPWNHEVRPGDNKWTSGMFARDSASDFPAIIAAAQSGVTLLNAIPRNSRQQVGVWITRIENMFPLSIILSPLRSRAQCTGARSGR
jgi:hypothetical protein